MSDINWIEELAAQLETHKTLTIFMDPGDGNLEFFDITNVGYDGLNKAVEVEITPYDS